MTMRKTIATGIAIVSVALGATVLDPSFEKVEWVASQSTMLFDTPSGDLEVGQYSRLANDQLFVNLGDGTIENDDLEKPLKLSDLRDLERVNHLGDRYEDIFADGVKKAVTRDEYVALSTKERIPERSVLRMGRIANGAIANEATAQADSSGYVNSLTLAIDCTETDRGVLTFVANRVLADISGATHNGDAMTSEVSSNNSGVAGIRAYSRTAADSGNNNVVVSLSEYRLLSMFNVCLSGTDQTDMVEATEATATGYGTSVSDSITSSTDGAWVFSGINLQSAYSLTPDSGETEINDTDHSDANLGQFGVSYILDATAGSETMGWSWSTNDNHAHVVLVVKPSSSGGGGGTSKPSSVFNFE